MNYDVIVIGSGAAGLSVALNAKYKNLSVLVLSKSYPTHSQSVQAQGGINAVLYEDNDSVENHINDTYKASYNLANKENIKTLCENAKESINWLDKIGVPFSRNDGKISQRKFGGTKSIRTCYSSDYTGLKIMQTLLDQAIKENIDFRHEHQLLNLIIEDNQCIGITALDIINGEVIEIFAQNIVMATGGYAGIYHNHTTNSFSSTGDGIVVALNNGAIISNMEFVQFHPTTLKDSNILISESARAEGAYLLDKNKNRFIDELESRDKVSKAIYLRNKNLEEVYLDFRHLDKEIIDEKIPQESNLAKEFANIDIKNELLPINVSAHYTMGGILIDSFGQTNIKNLFACGEVAQSNIHGANRLGGNSLLEVIGYGKIVAQKLQKTSIDFTKYQNSSQLKNDIKDINRIFELPNKINFYEEKSKLGDTLFDNLGVIKDKNSILKTLDILKSIEKNINQMGIKDKSKIYNKNLVDFIEFKNSLIIAKMICNSALNREESRGSHIREDFPNIDDKYEKNSYIKKIDTQLKYSFGE